MQAISQDVEPQMWRVKKVAEVLGIAIPTVYLWVRQGRFPKPKQLGPKATGWLSTDVISWMNNLQQIGDDS